MESDWRKFRDMAPTLRERYLAEHNPRLVDILTNPNKTETERFWDTLEAMEKQAKVLQRCLDGHSRSKMQLFMACMLQVGMLKKEDLTQFSQELQGQLIYAISQKEQ